jgi:predicted  nucleic acid-binding Zn-ribbon protein
LIGVTQQPEERLQGLERRVRVLEKLFCETQQPEERLQGLERRVRVLEKNEQKMKSELDRLEKKKTALQEVTTLTLAFSRLHLSFIAMFDHLICIRSFQCF